MWKLQEICLPEVMDAGGEGRNAQWRDLAASTAAGGNQRLGSDLIERPQNYFF